MTDRQLPDAMLALQPLVLKRTILLPYEFDSGKVFRELSWAIAWIKDGFDPDKEDDELRIVIRCQGIGGDTSDLLACIDLLKTESEDGTRIEGYLYGNCASAHAAFWAACPYRYALTRGGIELHSTRHYFYNTLIAPKDMRLAETDLRRIIPRQAEVFAAACVDPEYDADYWVSILDEHPSETVYIGAEDLVNKYQMCELYGDK